MKLKVNGEEKEFSKESLTVSELLVLEDVKMPEMVSVEFNSEMLDRDKFETTVLNNGDAIEFLYFMGGGGH